MLESPKVICYTQSKDDRIFDVVVNDIRLTDEDLDKQRYIDLAGEGITDPSDHNDKWFNLVISKKNPNVIRGYLIPDNPGPKGRLRPCIFYAKTSDKTNEETVDSVLNAIALLDLEVSDSRRNEFRESLLKELNPPPSKVGLLGLIIAISTAVTAAIYAWGKRKRSASQDSQSPTSQSPTRKERG